MYGHAEARERLSQCGVPDAEIKDLELAVDGYADFARVVADELRWTREQSDDDADD
ncbi:hypothetical protein [Halorubrum coriense]|uniref:hypothetical protein n=1 Tax=Halorubrum coriense TaxID=64713 RepID=UPI0013770DA5|nr:hypothetical protein [Halorubrum coriense]